MIKALIPARGGSKGILKKNMSILDGKPLIFYTINEVLKILDPKDIYLSSDSDEILNYGNTFKINLIKRPNKISGDKANSADVIGHFIKDLQEKKDYTIVYLQPTSPLRKASHIQESLNIFSDNHCDSLISISESKELPNKAYIINENNRLKKMILSKNKSELRQDFPNSYYPNGSIYVFNKNCFLKEKSIPTKNVLPYYMDEEYSIDIDTKTDLKFAEFLIIRSKK